MILKNTVLDEVLVNKTVVDRNGMKCRTEKVVVV
jgi:hypothetical protein